MLSYYCLGGMPDTFEMLPDAESDVSLYAKPPVYGGLQLLAITCMR